MLLCPIGVRLAAARAGPVHSAKNSANGRRNAMSSRFRLLVLAAIFALAPGALQFLAPLALAPEAFAQGDKPGVERLYILNCGEGVAGDISRWSPGVNEGKSMDFVANCYLIKHSQGGF